jgi:hypothetical protein
LRDGLLQLRKPYVFLWLDDLVPLRMDHLATIKVLISRLISCQGNYLRVNPSPPAHGHEVLPGMREIRPGEIYRTATVYSVWRRETLLSLLRSEETAWQFEFAGSARSDSLGGFYASTRELVPFVNLVVKGLVDPCAERTLLSEGVQLWTLKRPRMNAIQLAGHRIRGARARALTLVPWQVRRALRNQFSTNPKTR